METTISPQPLPSSQRLTIIDSLRGWALLGVVMMNYIDFYSGGRNPLLIGAEIIFAAKSWTLLSLLFGFGFAILMDRGMKGSVFMRRMGWLFVLAIINTAFYAGDILRDYAVLGAILFLFKDCKPKTCLWIGLILIAVTPWISYQVDLMPSGAPMSEKIRQLYYSHKIWEIWYRNFIGTWHGEIRNLVYTITVHVVMMACFFLGLAAHKSGFFANLIAQRKIMIRIALVCLGFCIAIWICILCFGLAFNQFCTHIKADLYWWEPLAGAACITSTICLIFLSGKMQRIFRALQYMGRMTLTNYMTQNIISFFLFSGAGFSLRKAGLPAWFFLGLALLVYILQVILSRWWLKRYKYGPIEWAWRCLSYRKRLPLT
jgi:uncharacterized protein